MNTLTNSVRVDILVNGSSCKQYFHEGKIYIEAKEGSEYQIKIANTLRSRTSSGRIMVVTSVDGLNVLNGKPAAKDDLGYLISPYSSEIIDGFRYSQEKVAAFKFAKKASSYAASKGTGAEVNCGVIGVVAYDELVPATNLFPKISKPAYPDWDYPPLISYRDGGFVRSSPTKGVSHSVECSTNSLMNGERVLNSKSASLSFNSIQTEVQTKGFDMGSEWGRAKQSHVRTVEFSPGECLGRVEIYYASRESLIEMGVIKIREKELAFPQSFPLEFSERPKGWKE